MHVQLAGVLSVLALAAVLLADYALRGMYTRAFDRESNRNGRVTLQLLEKHEELRRALAARDEQQARALVRQLQADGTTFRYLVLLDAQGRPLASAGVASKADLTQVIATHRAGEESKDVLRFTREVVQHEPLTGRSSSLGRILLGLPKSGARVLQSYKSLAMLLFIGAAFVLALLAFLSRLLRRFNQVRQFAEALSAGKAGTDISSLVSGSDEICQLAVAVQEMAHKFATMVGRLRLAAAALAQTSSELLESSTRQRESTARQATSVSETGATVAELRETFRHASERAQRVIDLAKRSEESTSSGKQSVDQSVEAMKEIRDQVVTTSEAFVGLVGQTEQIATLIDTVKDLAEQSNVLALNAAVEAAKAGDHGRGFTVVAREVRSLAERSKSSTAQVQKILKEIGNANQEALMVIQEGTRRAQAGMELANRAGTTILELDRAIKESSTAAKQIAASTRQQAVGVEQIWQAMRDIDRAVRESTTGTEELEQAAKGIKELADQMALLVEQYEMPNLGG